MTVKEALRFGVNHLKEFESNYLDSEILLASSLNKDRSYLYTYPEKKLTKEEKKDYLEKIVRRSRSEPVAYILGYKEFFGLNLKITQEVLIPRPETECLVEEVINILKERNYPKVKLLDLCTGSGAIGLALKNELPESEVTLSDISSKALEVTKENAHRLGLNVKVISSNLFDNIDKEFNVIISNPPYISKEEFKDLSKDILLFEPEIALLAKEDGLEFYKKIVSQAKNYLKEDGILIVEIGYKQGEAVREIYKNYNFQNIEIKQDLSGMDRFVIGIK